MKLSDLHYTKDNPVCFKVPLGSKKSMRISPLRN